MNLVQNNTTHGVLCEYTLYNHVSISSHARSLMSYRGQSFFIMIPSWHCSFTMTRARSFLPAVYLRVLTLGHSKQLASAAPAAGVPPFQVNHTRVKSCPTDADAAASMYPLGFCFYRSCCRRRRRSSTTTNDMPCQSAWDRMFRQCHAMMSSLAWPWQRRLFAPPWATTPGHLFWRNNHTITPPPTRSSVPLATAR